ncbi:hypothetical protein HOE04_01865 [archaeon]|jgi:hypothetical protein|nr:hypothetical protein [archaeon]
MTDIREKYKAYLKQAESLPKEMKRRGIQYVNPRFMETDFVVYVDGTAEVPRRAESFLEYIGLKSRPMKRIGLDSVGELLYHLTSDPNRYNCVPKDLNQIDSFNLERLTNALSLEEDVVRSSKKLIEGLGF